MVNIIALDDLFSLNQLFSQRIVMLPNVPILYYDYDYDYTPLTPLATTIHFTLSTLLLDQTTTNLVFTQHQFAIGTTFQSTLLKLKL